jgi:membrane protein implicated in regulation of membrane protease activity
MHVMLLLMMLPIMAIPVFWFLPAAAAVPIYIFVVLLSGSMYWLMWRTMMQPAVSGAESLVGREVEVVSRSSENPAAPYMVHVEGELWSARSRDALQPGETVVIVAAEGNRLTVARKDTITTPTGPD